MKKFASFVVGLLMVSTIFAQSSKKLIAGVYNFATESSVSCEIVEPNFTSVDPISEKFSFDGGFIIKNIIGLTRYDFTCSIVKQNDDFSVELTNMNSYACDKNGKIVKTGKKYTTGAKVAAQYAQQMKDEINARMSSWSDGEYEINLSKAVTAPLILGCVANNSALLFKKFIKDYEVIGKPISIKINVTNIDEAPSYAEGYSYYVGGNVLSGYRQDEFGINFPKYAQVMVYTNNDDVISLTPAETMDALLSSGQSGSVYEVNGTIRDVSQKSTGGLSVIQVNE